MSAERILIVDDEPNIRTMMRLALEFSGYEVEVAADGPEGLEKFGDGAGWDLVLLDQRMPGMSGTDVQAEIRRRSPATRVVFITAYGTIDMALEAMKVGAVDFLRKPFTADILRQAVRSALGRAVQSTSAVPANAIMGVFTRTTINGFNFNLAESAIDETSHERSTSFEVDEPDGTTTMTTVRIPAFVLELVKAYADAEVMPCGEQFWTALAEEALANYLWQHAELPPNRLLVVDDLSQGLQRWLDAILTIGAEGESDE